MIAIARPWPVMTNSEFARPSLVSEPFEPDEETRDIDFGDEDDDWVDSDFEDRDDVEEDEEDFDTELDEEEFDDDLDDDLDDECPDAGYAECPCPVCTGQNDYPAEGVYDEETDPLGLIGDSFYKPSNFAAEGIHDWRRDNEDYNSSREV